LAAKINESLKRDSVQAPPTRNVDVTVAEEEIDMVIMISLTNVFESHNKVEI
jgi:hypothetical protein